jgi:hypothetical protein
VPGGRPNAEPGGRRASGAALIDPDAGRVLFGKYASDWIEERPGLRPKTAELYRYLLRRHLGRCSMLGRSLRSANPMCGAGGRI